jgi:phosphate:Na+ symporter
MEIIAFSINLEHIGDIIDKNFRSSPSRRLHAEFSKEGSAELADFHKRIIDNLRLAFSVFINDNVKTRARSSRKNATQPRSSPCGQFRRGCARSPGKHRDESFHLDVLRDLKRIHSNICSVAYPVLEATGELQPNSEG